MRLVSEIEWNSVCGADGGSTNPGPGSVPDKNLEKSCAGSPDSKLVAFETTWGGGLGDSETLGGNISTTTRVEGTCGDLRGGTESGSGSSGGGGG